MSEGVVFALQVGMGVLVVASGRTGVNAFLSAANPAVPPNLKAPKPNEDRLLKASGRIHWRSKQQ
jgi:hypothetical protein